MSTRQVPLANGKNVLSGHRDTLNAMYIYRANPPLFQKIYKIFTNDKSGVGVYSHNTNPKTHTKNPYNTNNTNNTNTTPIQISILNNTLISQLQILYFTSLYIDYPPLLFSRLKENRKKETKSKKKFHPYFPNPKKRKKQYPSHYFIQNPTHIIIRGIKKISFIYLGAFAEIAKKFIFCFAQVYDWPKRSFLMKKIFKSLNP